MRRESSVRCAPMHCALTDHAESETSQRLCRHAGARCRTANPEDHSGCRCGWRDGVRWLNGSFRPRGVGAASLHNAGRLRLAWGSGRPRAARACCPCWPGLASPVPVPGLRRSAGGLGGKRAPTRPARGCGSVGRGRGLAGRGPVGRRSGGRPWGARPPAGTKQCGYCPRTEPYYTATAPSACCDDPSIGSAPTRGRSS